MRTGRCGGDRLRAGGLGRRQDRRSGRGRTAPRGPPPAIRFGPRGSELSLRSGRQALPQRQARCGCPGGPRRSRGLARATEPDSRGPRAHRSVRTGRGGEGRLPGRRASRGRLGQGGLSPRPGSRGPARRSRRRGRGALLVEARPGGGGISGPGGSHKRGAPRSGAGSIASRLDGRGRGGRRIDRGGARWRGGVPWSRRSFPPPTDSGRRRDRRGAPEAASGGAADRFFDLIHHGDSPPKNDEPARGGVSLGLRGGGTLAASFRARSVGGLNRAGNTSVPRRAWRSWPRPLDRGTTTPPSSTRPYDGSTRRRGTWAAVAREGNFRKVFPFCRRVSRDEAEAALGGGAMTGRRHLRPSALLRFALRVLRVRCNDAPARSRDPPGALQAEAALARR